MAGRAIGATLATVAVTFKLAFTNEDSPELMLWASQSLNPELGVTLVTRARIAFIAIAIALLYTLLTGFSNSGRAEGILCLVILVKIF